MPYGHHGRLILCDLTNQTWETIAVSEDDVRSYLLGSGLAAKILYEELQPGLDPLAP